MDSTVRCLGVEIEDALGIADSVERYGTALRMDTNIRQLMSDVCFETKADLWFGRSN